MDFHFIGLTGLNQCTIWLHWPVSCDISNARSLKKVDVIYICFLLFYNIELYIKKILR